MECCTKRRWEACRLAGDIYGMDYVRGKHGQQCQQTQDDPYTMGHLGFMPPPTLMVDAVFLAAAAYHGASPHKRHILSSIKDPGWLQDHRCRMTVCYELTFTLDPRAHKASVEHRSQAYAQTVGQGIAVGLQRRYQADGTPCHQRGERIAIFHTGEAPDRNIQAKVILNHRLKHQ